MKKENKQNSTDTAVGTVYTGLSAKIMQTERREPEIPGHSTSKSFYGSSVPTNDPDAAFDYRYYENSIMRFSPYFERVREYNENMKNFAKSGGIAERYCEENRMNLDYSEGIFGVQLEILPDCKIIEVDSGQKIHLYNNGTVLLLGMDALCPELFLVPDKFVAGMDMPYADMLFAKGLMPDTLMYTAEIIDIEDTVTPDGGTLHIRYETSSGGRIIGNVTIEMVITKPSAYEDLVEYTEEKCVKVPRGSRMSVKDFVKRTKEIAEADFDAEKYLRDFEEDRKRQLGDDYEESLYFSADDDDGN